MDIIDINMAVQKMRQELANPASASNAALAATYTRRGEVLEPLTIALRAAGSSFGIQVLGDSTGNETSEWPYLLGQSIAAAYPAYGVRHRLWNDATQKYDAPAFIQTPPNGERGLTFNGASNSFSYLAHEAAHVITGDIDISAKVALADWTPAGEQNIVAKFGSTGTRSWRFFVTTDGKLHLSWSTDGAASISDVGSTVAPTVTDGTALWVRVTFDVDNGATGKDIKFYTSTDGSAWTQLGTTVTQAGVTSIFDATYQMELGTRSTGTGGLIGTVHEVRVRKGIDGPTVVPVLPEAWQPSSGTIVKTGSPIVDIINASKSGAGITYFNDTTRQPLLTPDYMTLAAFISCSHNDGSWMGKSYLAQWSTLSTTLKARLPLALTVVLGQNPRTAPANFITEHEARMGQQMTWAIQNGAGYINATKAFKDSPLGVAALVSAADGIHPTAAGSQLWRDVILTELLARA